VPVFRRPVIAVLRLPLYAFNAIGREVQGIVFYHRNYVDRRRLLSRIDFLNNRLVAMKEISSENTRLANLLALKQETPYKVVAARVIGRDPSNWSSSLIIDKGYGFIGREDGGADIFVHFSAIEMDGYRRLREGQQVEFSVEDGPKGLQAAGVKPVE